MLKKNYNHEYLPDFNYAIDSVGIRNFMYPEAEISF